VSTEPELNKPPRRPRYRGTHPRHFSDKYKERHPEKYPETVRKVVESGKTPAGSHRPICVQEILDVLAPQPGETAVDATLGYGGHAAELLRRVLPGGRLIGLDVDPIELPRTEARLRASGLPEESFVPIHSNFAGLARALRARGIEGADVILADLGLSSMQIDDPTRGFSYKTAGPLDLRMNPLKGQPASVLAGRLTEEQWTELLIENADESHAREIAAAIVRAREERPILTTLDLARVVRQVVARMPRQVQEVEGDGPVRRTFQALRIAVNEEFSALETFLRFLPDSLNAGGRVAILTFHSGEDRRVKKAFQEGERSGIYAEVAREVIRPSPEEIRSNPRASSAKLRWARKRTD
jgi:16S rRNA (cytosine1402-N4)-methyltransferase